VAPALTRPQLAEARRVLAAELLGRGLSQAEVARKLEVSPDSVRRWQRAMEREGAAGLRRRPPSGRPPKVDAAQARQVEEALLEGPLAHGFDSDEWTTERVRVVIERLCGVQLSIPSVWRLLTVRLGWSRRVPEGQTQEGDEPAPARWVKAH
jgi:transposase